MPEPLRLEPLVAVIIPTIRLVDGAYRDFTDHHVAVTKRSLAEAAGLRTSEGRARFLLYSTKSRLPRNPALIEAYLAFSPAWLLPGKPTHCIGERTA